jgi:hypothetical protein
MHAVCIKPNTKNTPTHRHNHKHTSQSDAQNHSKHTHTHTHTHLHIAAKQNHTNKKHTHTQVRKRVILALAEAVDFGDTYIYTEIVAALEDTSLATRQTAFRSLTAALFGRGSYMAERNHMISVYTSQGMTRWDAAERAAEDAKNRRGGVDADLVVIKVGFLRVIVG